MNLKFTDNQCGRLS